MEKWKTRAIILLDNFVNPLHRRLPDHNTSEFNDKSRLFVLIKCTNTHTLSLTVPHTHTHTLAISWSQGLPFSQSGLNTALLAHRIMPSPLLPLKRRGGLKKNSIHIFASTLLRQRNGPPTRVCKWKRLCYKWICLLTGKSVDYWNHRSCWTRTELDRASVHTKNVVGDFYCLPQKSTMQIWK